MSFLEKATNSLSKLADRTKVEAEELSVKAKNLAEKAHGVAEEKVQQMRRTNYKIIECSSVEEYAAIINAAEEDFVCSFVKDNKIIITFKE